MGNWPHGLGKWPHGLGKWPHELGNWPHRPGARRQNAHIVSRKMLHFAYRNFVGKMQQIFVSFCLCVNLPIL
jgi:hypothetical protein